MDCKDVNKMLYSFLDGELGEAMHRKVQQHITTCEQCIETISYLREVNSVIEAEKVSLKQNPYFAKKVANRIQSESSHIATPVIPLRRFTIASIAAAGILLGVLLGSMVSTYINTKPSAGLDSHWTQLADDYFPNELYSPYDEFNGNNN